MIKSNNCNRNYQISEKQRKCVFSNTSPNQACPAILEQRYLYSCILHPIRIDIWPVKVINVPIYCFAIFSAIEETFGAFSFEISAVKTFTSLVNTWGRFSCPAAFKFDCIPSFLVEFVILFLCRKFNVTLMWTPPPFSFLLTPFLCHTSLLGMISGFWLWVFVVVSSILCGGLTFAPQFFVVEKWQSQPMKFLFLWSNLITNSSS